MRLFDRWREILSTLSRRKLRTALTALSVAWGIFMLVVLLAAGQGLANGAEAAFNDEATNTVWVRGGSTRIPFQGQPRGRRISLTNDDYEMFSKAVPIADHIAGRYYPRADATASYKDRQGSFEVRGTHPDYRFIERTTLDRGRYLNDTDIQERRKVAVIGKRVVSTLFRDGTDPVGAYFNLGKNKFRVIGTFSDTGEDREQERIYIPFTTGQLAFGGANRIDSVAFTVGDATVEQTGAAINDVRRRLGARHGFAANHKGALRIQNSYEFHEKMNGVLWAIRTFVWLIGLGTIMAGVVGVGNIMLIAVKERTREFGVRKALGASPRSIVTMVMEEALAITTASGYLGLVCAVAVVHFAGKLLPDSEYFKNPDVDIGVGLSATAVLIVAGLLAGLWPARHAARISPIEALRSEV